MQSRFKGYGKSLVSQAATAQQFSCVFEKLEEMIAKERPCRLAFRRAFQGVLKFD